MHRVLLIDEVFQVLLEHCADWSASEYRFILCQLARSCKAWKDPATDCLWRRLDSIDPLLRLLSATSDGSQLLKEANDISSSFTYYASKVKHIAYASAPVIIAKSHGPLLPNLSSVRLSLDGCLIPPTWMESTKLHELDINLGMSSEKDTCKMRSSSVAVLLSRVNVCSSSGITKLRVRGWMAPVMDSSIKSLASLRHLILHTGKSLSSETLASLASLPHLETLSVHASHVSADDFIGALPVRYNSFPRLHTLRIRAQRSLVCSILEQVKSGALRSIHLESEEPEQGHNAWRDTFALIVSKAADTLIDFTVDQILEHDEIDNSPAGAGADLHFTIDALQALKGLHNLRRLTIDMMVPPEFSDQDIASVGQWWPHLEHLNMGILPGTLDSEHAAQPWKPKTTFAALRALAKACQHLRSLVLPLDIVSPLPACASPADDASGWESDAQIRQQSLKSLHVGHAGTADAVPSFVRRALDIFPQLEEIDCSTTEKSTAVQVDATLQGEESADRTAGTEDGYADGQ